MAEHQMQNRNKLSGSHEWSESHKRTTGPKSEKNEECVSHLKEENKQEECKVHNKQMRLQEFRRAVLVVQFVRNMIKLYKDYAATKEKSIPFAGLTGTRNYHLLFDASEFQAKKERGISNEVMTILSRPPQTRMAEDIRMAVISLGAAVDTFAEYPIHMQKKLAQVGWYESFGPGRVIIRQGHIPQNFYLILSGTVLVSKLSINKHTGEPFARTSAFLKKGKTFGDVAILTGAKRNATVTCHDTVALLAVSRQDFLTTFLSGNAQDEPEFIEYLRKTDVLSGWPLDKLPLNKPTICVHTFFRRNAVISRDTKVSSKIYIIKTGTVKVLKNLTVTNPRQLLLTTRSGEEKFSFQEMTSTGRHHKNSDMKSKVPSKSISVKMELVLPVLQQNAETLVEQPVLPHLCFATSEKNRHSKKETSELIYINVQTLKAGDIFGLAYLLFEETFPMMLVSEGAECIVISKDFFKQHASDSYLRRLYDLVPPYPTEDVLQKKLQQHINWEANKSLLFHKRFPKKTAHREKLILPPCGSTIKVRCAASHSGESRLMTGAPT
ncbi:cyclic nucleotide-binding domain-containing protein 2-like isoform X2 [Polypterus senegalus]|uniref:cyclic nucleotide-binding domain-containing protein 2-like isoform X2 n=1 Tax=Polypterus senegalus TaxID=55291 RepID=UPI00196466D3|nr:cyclic nucleotide-binding domain-containing protein 2-like isoform X2 [Polypterus senegalus]